MAGRRVGFVLRVSLHVYRVLAGHATSLPAALCDLQPNTSAFGVGACFQPLCYGSCWNGGFAKSHEIHGGRGTAEQVWDP